MVWGLGFRILRSSEIGGAVDDKKSCITHNNEFTIIPIFRVLTGMQDLYHQQY